MEQHVSFCTNPEGARIAYRTLGHGPAIVICYLMQVATFGAIPQFRHFYEVLARYHTVVFFDSWGIGLSDRNRTVFTLESELQNVETVINHLKLDKVILAGASMSGPIAIAYAAKYPERVSQLILFGTYAYYGKYVSDEVRSSILTLLRQQNNWLGLRSVLSLLLPKASADLIELFLALTKEFVTAENFASFIEMLYMLDVTDLCPGIKASTLVMHRKGDLMIDFKAGLELASLIPNSQFVPLEGISHQAFQEDSGTMQRAIFEFLGDPVPDDPADDVSNVASLNLVADPKTEQRKVSWLRLDHPLVYIIATVLASVIAGIILTLFKC